MTLVALSSEQSPLKRSFLKLCAGISAAAIVIPLVIFVIVASSGGGGGGGTESKGPCVGGPDMGATGTPTSNGDVIFPARSRAPRRCTWATAHRAEAAAHRPSTTGRA